MKKIFDFFRTLFWDNHFTGIRKKCYYFNTLFTKPNGSPSKGNPYNKQPRCYLLNSCFVDNFKSEQIVHIYFNNRSAKAVSIQELSAALARPLQVLQVRPLAYCFKTKLSCICWKRKKTICLIPLLFKTDWVLTHTRIYWFFFK